MIKLWNKGKKIFTKTEFYFMTAMIQFSLLISLLAILICLSFRRKDRLQREFRVDGPLGLK